MKKRCEHSAFYRRVWRTGGDDVKQWFDAASFEAADAMVCVYCGAWLYMGQATDTPATAIEVRAAEIAVNVSEMTEWWLWVGRNTSQDENYGWRDWGGGGDVKNWHAGYLARAIVDHEGSTP